MIDSSDVLGRPLVAVHADKYPKGISSLDEGQHAELVDLEPFRVAFGRERDTDAHFSTYAVVEANGRIATQQPRLNSGADAAVRQAGGRIVSWGYVADADLKDNPALRAPIGADGKPYWSAEARGRFLELLGELVPVLSEQGLGVTLAYLTEHGARLVHVFTEPIDRNDYPPIAAGMRGVYARHGLALDAACDDKTRLFRGPRVVRDSVRTWEQEWFDEFDFGDLTDPNRVPRGAAGKTTVRAVLGSEQPDEEQAEQLRTAHADELLRLAAATDFLLVHDLLAGRVRLGQDLRDVNLLGRTGSLVQWLHPFRVGTPALSYSLLESVAAELEPDRGTRDWLESLWKKVLYCWAKEDEKADERGEWEDFGAEPEPQESGEPAPLKRAEVDAIEFAVARDSRLFPADDTTNSGIIKDLHGDHIRYLIDYQSFAVYDAKKGRWQIDGRERPRLKSRAKVLRVVWRSWARIAQTHADRIQAQLDGVCSLEDEAILKAAMEDATAEAKRCRAMAKVAGDDRGIRGAINMLMALPELRMESSAFDADEALLNLPNGTLDLRSGKLKPHDPADLLMKQANVSYDPDAKSSTFTPYMEWMFSATELRAFFQRLCGSFLLGRRVHQKLWIVEGPGANGKSTWFDLLLRMLGDYAVKAPQTWLLDRGDKEDFATMLCRGARFVVACETNKAAKLDSARIKALTGDDELSARVMYVGHIRFLITFDIVQLVNPPLPEIHDDSLGMWRRVRVIPCHAQIEGEPDDRLLDKLMAEAPAILNWLVAGLHGYLEGGLQEPQEVIEASSRYRTESDPVREFLAEALVEDPEGRVQVSALHQRFAWWANSRQVASASAKVFGERLRTIYGARAVSKSHGVMVLRGYRLADSDNETSRPVPGFAGARLLSGGAA